jgi:uncharacterized membrane protein YeaQ/YmgE (transglycosylase-associated protein family)
MSSTPSRALVDQAERRARSLVVVSVGTPFWDAPYTVPTSMTGGGERHPGPRGKDFPRSASSSQASSSGALARLLGPVREEYLDPLATIGLGITGSLVGGLVARSFSAGRVFALDLIGFVLAVVGAAPFIGVAGAVAVRNKSIG